MTNEYRIHGYSVLELLVALAICAIVSVISIPVCASIAARYALLREHQLLLDTVQSAVTLSRSSERSAQLFIATSSYRAIGAFDVAHVLPSSMRLESTPPTFTFYSNGVVSPGTIRLAHKDRFCTVVISLRGRISERCS